jgi:hypothetical protein
MDRLIPNDAKTSRARRAAGAPKDNDADQQAQPKPQRQ